MFQYVLSTWQDTNHAFLIIMSPSQEVQKSNQSRVCSEKSSHGYHTRMNNDLFFENSTQGIYEKVDLWHKGECCF